MKLSRQIKNYREDNQLSQAAFAALVSDECFQAYVSQWERETHKLQRGDRFYNEVRAILAGQPEAEEPEFQLNGTARPMLRQALEMALESGDIPEPVRHYCEAVLELEAA